MTNFKNTIATAACALAMSVGMSLTPDSAEAGVDPYLGDIMIVGFNFCPLGWASASGQILPISANQALFSLLGTQFGGDGRTTFALPDLRGRVTVGQGAGPGLAPVAIGQHGGAETNVMTAATMPSHSHSVNANNLDGDKPGPGGKLLAAAPANGAGNETIYSTEPANVTMNPAMIANTGSGAPIPIQDPYLSVVHCIALQGAFPPRN